MTIISILGFLGGIFEIVIGGLLLIAGTAILGSGEVALSPVLAVAVSIAAVILIGFGLFDLMIFWGLWNGKNWARVIFMLLEVLGVIGSVATLFANPIVGIVGIIISGAILYYLFRPHVKAYFGVQVSSGQAPA